MSLKQKLRQLVQTTDAPRRVFNSRLTPEQDKARNIQAENFVIKTKQIRPREFLKMPRNPLMFHKAAFNALGTTLLRCRNPITVSNDVRRWLAKDKLTPALWILILAGKETGQVGRNDILRHLAENGRFELGRMVLQYTKKWGFPEDEYSTVALAESLTVDTQNTRKKFAAANLPPRPKQIFANVLLKPYLLSCNPKEGYEFFREIPRNVQTYQIMFSALIKRPILRRYRVKVLEMLREDVAAKLIETDVKLEETIEALRYYSNPKPLKGLQTDGNYEKAIDLERQLMHEAKHELDDARLKLLAEKKEREQKTRAKHGYVPRNPEGRFHGWRVENVQYQDVLEQNRYKEEAFRASLAYGQDAVPMASYLRVLPPKGKSSSRNEK